MTSMSSRFPRATATVDFPAPPEPITRIFFIFEGPRADARA
jgi:hypothetical protein